MRFIKVAVAEVRETDLAFRMQSWSTRAAFGAVPNPDECDFYRAAHRVYVTYASTAGTALDLEIDESLAALTLVAISGPTTAALRSAGGLVDEDDQFRYTPNAGCDACSCRPGFLLPTVGLELDVEIIITVTGATPTTPATEKTY